MDCYSACFYAGLVLLLYPTYRCLKYGFEKIKWDTAVRAKNKIQDAELLWKWEQKWKWHKPIFPAISAPIAALLILFVINTVNTKEAKIADCQKRKLEKETKVSKGDKIGNNRNSCRWS